MSTYVISDMGFNNLEMAQAAGFSTIKEFHNSVIKKWNHSIDKNDTVFIYGVLGAGSLDDFKNIFSKLNGTLYLADYKLNSQYSREEWKQAGFKHIFNNNFFYSIDNKPQLWFCHPDDSLNDSRIYITTSESDLHQVYSKNCLSIEAKYWDFTPIKVQELYNIIERMKEYVSMEDINESN